MATSPGDSVVTVADGSPMRAAGEAGREALGTRVRFAPDVTVDKATLDDIHHHAHEECFIALSVKTEVAVEPEY